MFNSKKSFAPQMPKPTNERRKCKTTRTNYSRLRAIPAQSQDPKRIIRVIIAKKVSVTRRQKRNLDGLFELLAPGRTIAKECPTKSMIKEPNKAVERVSSSNIAKLGTIYERSATLAQYADRRPPKINEKLWSRE